MSYLSIPLQVVKTGLARQASIKKSLDESINLLVSTPRFHNVADPNFGFIFNNMRFEIFDEHEGVIYNSGDTIYETSSQDIYNMKISGSSKT